ncbi:hypothetical protein TWF696_005869 [Orbilia brochopaga]|uniref:Peptidyl-tRNA hydrolase n=1 Tax=Orbilia brochopaga TaxID=3140254 RepID=A0AAV9UVC2_9PEZI
MGIKGKRRQRQRREQAAQHIQHEQHADSSESPEELSPSSSSATLSIPTTASPEEPEMLDRHILLCAIGNPGKLLATRHSAAHILLPHLATSPLRTSRPHGGPTADGPSFTAEPPSPPPSPLPAALITTLFPSKPAAAKQKQKSAVEDSYTTTLFQSTAFMNASGPAVSKAWRTFTNSLPGPARSRALLVILHDELERPVGTIKYKKDGSAGGHNGLSSIASSLPGQTVHKIGLGINRPQSREPDVVADYVLSTMPRGDVDRMIEDALPAVKEVLHKLGTTGRYLKK